ncbi:hypothetical protein SESBI_49558 [Sesbania bispinosa]|nr:hypothetical protein SESBI_49558 [Sesbania bispinosa]
MAMVEEDEQGQKLNEIIPRRQSTRNKPLTIRVGIFSKQILACTKDTEQCCRACTIVKTMLHPHSSGHVTPVSIEEKYLNGDSSVNENISRPLDYIKV